MVDDGADGLAAVALATPAPPNKSATVVSVMPTVYARITPAEYRYSCRISVEGDQ